MKNSYFMALLIGLNTATIACTKNTSSNVKRETDDSFTSYTKNLIDTSGRLENFVNASIHESRKLATFKSPIKGQVGFDKNKFLDDVYNSLGAELDGTGYRIPTQGEVLKYVAIESWIEKNFNPKLNEIVYLKFAQTKYKNSPIGIYDGWGNSMLLTKFGANLAIAGVILNRKTIVGIDKWGHFFDIGFLYYKNRELRESLSKRDDFSLWLEGDPDLSRDARIKCEQIAKSIPRELSFGIYGSVHSGVTSYADKNANEAGFQFYDSLSKNPTEFKFELDKIDLDKFNERSVPSQFSNGTIAR